MHDVIAPEGFNHQHITYGIRLEKEDGAREGKREGEGGENNNILCFFFYSTCISVLF